MIDQTKLSEIINQLSAIRPYEFQVPILSTSKAISDQVIQKLKIHSYQRKIRTYEVGSNACKTVPHTNIKVVKDLELAKKRVKDAENACKTLRDGREKIVDDLKNNYKQAQNDIISCQSVLKKWEDLEESQLTYMNLSIKEIQEAYKICKTLIPKVKIAKMIRDTALDFYDDYYIYVKYMDKVRNNYVCDLPFIKFKQFLDANYMEKEEKATECEKKMKKLLNVKKGLQDIVEGTFGDCKQALNEAINYHQLLIEEEYKCDNCKMLMNQTQKFIKDVIGDKELALMALDSLVAKMLNTFPKRLFQDIDITTLQGKLNIVTNSYETYMVMIKLLKERKVPKIVHPTT